ncbi:NADP-dependent oxidoreductase domain-containing protein [Aspergillus stella-maris]|uniref:NADP-dependent oxidoreductase domain-containing protein n=1 Tax=Aspergillus stella-maris TaxID=1810926 RepID=UPI003CCD888C
MKYVKLGQSDLRVSPKGRYPFAVAIDEALRILDHYYRSGLNYYDTANSCFNGESEAILGQAIKNSNWRHENLVIATNITTPYVDLLQIHGIDPQTPVEETVEALHDVVKPGKARYIGASFMRTHQFLEYQYGARINGWTEFITMQSLHTVIYQEEEREIYPSIAKSGMAAIPWSPVLMGFLTQPWKTSVDSMRATVWGFPFYGYPFTEVDKRINEKIEEITEVRGVNMTTVVLAYSLAKPFSTALIVGMSKKKRVDEALKALELRLTEEEIQSIDKLYVPRHFIGR